MSRFRSFQGSFRFAARSRTATRLPRISLAQAAAGSPLPADAAWLMDNYAFLQTQIREVRESLPPSYWRRLPAESGIPRVYPIAQELAELAGTDFSAARLQQLLESDARIAALSMAELWALGPMLKLVLLEAITPTAARRPITALRTFESVPWRDLVEEVSPVEQILRRDPAGVYARMNFRTRDDCRHAVEGIARRSRLDEKRRSRRSPSNWRARENCTVAHFLIGPGVRRTAGARAVIEPASASASSARCAGVRTSSTWAASPLSRRPCCCPCARCRGGWWRCWFCPPARPLSPS